MKLIPSLSSGRPSWSRLPFMKTLIPSLSSESSILRHPDLRPPSHPSVGITDRTNKTKSNIRIYYPAAAASTIQTPVPLFRRRLPEFVSGYLHVFLMALKVGFLRPFIDALLYLPLRLSPLNNAYLPCCSYGAPLAASKKPFPLLVWSHGLTGTGDEHGIMATALAMRGYVVACVHHSDGSSALADVAKERVYFDPPDFKNYDKAFRQGQIRVRVGELDGARSLVLRDPFFASSLSEDIVFAGGFSFGAATAGAASSKARGSKYKAAVLFDGWYHIYFEKYGIDIDLPKEMHSKLTSPDVPCLFVGSEAFEKQEKLNLKTKRVQALCPKPEVHVLGGTTHGNFMDAGTWLPGARALGLTGSAEYLETYREILNLMLRFLDRQAT